MNLSLISTAIAQEAASQGANQQNPIMSLIPFAVIFVIFYFLMIRPQSKKIKQEQEMLKALKKGDEVYTKSGILGKVHGLTDKVVTLEVEGGTHLKILRGQIAGLSAKIFAQPVESTKK